MARVEGPDQLYSWVIAAALCIEYACVSGLNSTTGLFYVAIIGTYGTTRKEASFPFTLRYLFRSLAAPLVGILGQRFSTRANIVAGSVFAVTGVILCSSAPNILWIYVFWGGLYGTGTAFMYTLLPITLTQYFVKYRATASGIAYSGSSLASFVFPLITETFLGNYGLNGAFLLTGGILMHTLPTSLLLIEPRWSKSLRSDNVLPKSRGNTKKAEKVAEGIHESSKTIQSMPSSKKDEENSEENLTLQRETSHTVQSQSTWNVLLRVYKNPMFHLISASMFMNGFLREPLTTIIFDYANDKGLGHHVGKYMIIALSVGDLIGKLCFGWVTDKEHLSESRLMMLNHVVQGICFLLIPVFYSLNMLLVIFILCSVSFGILLVKLPILIAKYLPVEQSLAMGCYSLLPGVIHLGVPFLIGYFRDNGGSYDYLFYMCGIFSIVFGVLWLSEPRLSQLRKEVPTTLDEIYET